MTDFSDTHIFANIQDFKSNTSHYIRLLEQRRYQAVVIKLYKRRVCVFMTNNHAVSEKGQKNVD